MKSVISYVGWWWWWWYEFGVGDVQVWEADGERLGCGY